MKLQTFIDELRAIAASRSDADLAFEWHEYMGEWDTLRLTPGFVDAKLLKSCVIVRLAVPSQEFPTEIRKLPIE